MEKVEVHRPPNASQGGEPGDLGTPRSPAFSSKKNASLKTLSDSLPTPTQLQCAADDFVYDGKGQKVKFGDLLQRDKKTLVVFVRHFRCALCQDFLVYITLGGKLTPEKLAENDAELIVVGCGGWRFIKQYQKLLNLPFAVYANPSTSIYKSLGMGNFHGVDKNVKSHYTAKGWYNMVLRSLIKALRMGHYFARAGDTTQLGGEFIFMKTPEGETEALFSHRMKTISDHSTADTLVNTLAAFPSGQAYNAPLRSSVEKPPSSSAS